MVTRMMALCPSQVAEPREDGRELDPLYCELRELEERYAGRSAWRLLKFALWRDAKYWKTPIDRLSRIHRRDASVIRRHIRSVSAELRILHGPPFGHPVEDLLGLN